MTISCESFAKFLDETGYEIISGQKEGVFFACLNHEVWETLAVIRIYDNGEAISTYNFVLEPKKKSLTSCWKGNTKDARRSPTRDENSSISIG